MKEIKLLFLLVFVSILIAVSSLAAHSQGWIDDDLLDKILIIIAVLLGLCFVVNLGGWMRDDELSSKHLAKNMRGKNDQSDS